MAFAPELSDFGLALGQLVPEAVRTVLLTDRTSGGLGVGGQRHRA